MGILRKIRKSNVKITKKRIVLLIFTLIMATFAWIAYYKILSPKFQMHINAWNLSIFVDENQNGVAEPAEEREKTSAIEVNFLEMYPDMNQEKVDIIIQNNGDTPAIFTYELSDVSFLGDSYDVVDDAEQSRLEDPDGKYIQRGTSTVAAGITTYELINEPGTFPFKFTVENCDSIAGGAEGTITVKALWANANDEVTEDEKNELDSLWGYNVAKFIEENPTIAPFQFNIKINAIGLGESDRFAFTKKITPENYGDFVDYPIDLNGDGKTTNDWKIFYEDNKNIFIIAAGYVKNTWVSDEVMDKSDGNYSTYGAFVPINKYKDEKVPAEIINKYMLSLAIPSSNSNYKATRAMLYSKPTTETPQISESWNQFIDTSLADSATAAPTIEMFVKSWNRKYNSVEGYSELKCAWNVQMQGYEINGDNRVEVEGYESAPLYFILENNEDDCNGYWLASPSVREVDGTAANTFLMGVSKLGTIGSAGIQYKGASIRPVVCLNENVKAERKFVSESGDEVSNVVGNEVDNELGNEVGNEVTNEPENGYWVWELSR